jgi:hypothetical protein
MKKRINILSTLTVAFAFTSTLLNAMSYSVNYNYLGYNLIYASGQIRHGDLYKLQKKYRNLNKSRQTIVVFNSNGGELQEGLNIGKFLKDKHIGSAVRKNGVCASSCALAFLGGRSKNNTKLRILPHSSKLGFHSFYYKNGNYVRLNKVQNDISNLLSYASYVGAPNYLMSKMFKTSSKKMYWVNRSDIRALNLKRGLSSLKFNNYAKNRVKQHTYQPYEINRLNAVSFIKEYISKINNTITSHSGYSNYSNVALNTRYKGWLSNNLKYAHIKNIKQITSRKVEAKVVYSLKNGQVLCSTNVYNLTKTYNGNWKIINKTYKACSSRSKRTLKVLAKALP